MDVLGKLLSEVEAEVDLAAAVRHEPEGVPPVPGLLHCPLTVLVLVEVCRTDGDLDPHLEGGALHQVVAEDPGEVGVVTALQSHHDRWQSQVGGVLQFLHQSGLGVVPDVLDLAVNINGEAGPAHHQAPPVAAGKEEVGPGERPRATAGLLRSLELSLTPSHFTIRIRETEEERREVEGRYLGLTMGTVTKSYPASELN